MKSALSLFRPYVEKLSELSPASDHGDHLNTINEDLNQMLKSLRIDNQELDNYRSLLAQINQELPEQLPASKLELVEFNSLCFSSKPILFKVAFLPEGNSVGRKESLDIILQCCRRVAASKNIDCTFALSYEESCKADNNEPPTFLMLSNPVHSFDPFYNLFHLYFQLDQRAADLYLLVRHFISFNIINSTEMYKSHLTTVPVMVIFYLQCMDPPILPNLHTILGDKALGCESPLHHSSNMEEIFSQWKPVPDSSKTRLVDLWLGFLRFYLFEFQRHLFVIDITSDIPRPRHSIHPSLVFFNPLFPERRPRRIGCENYQLFDAQLLNAYAFYALPQGAICQCMCDPVSQDESSQQPTNSSSLDADSILPDKEHQIHLCPGLDCQDQFETDLSNLDEKLTQLLEQHNFNDDDIHNEDVVEIIEPILTTILDQITSREDIELILSTVLALPNLITAFQSALLTSSSMTVKTKVLEVSRQIALDIWTRVMTSIASGQFTLPLSFLINMVVHSIKSAVYEPEILRQELNQSTDTVESEPVKQKKKKKNGLCDGEKVHTDPPLLSKLFVVEKGLTAASMQKKSWSWSDAIIPRRANITLTHSPDCCNSQPSAPSTAAVNRRADPFAPSCHEPFTSPACSQLSVPRDSTDDDSDQAALSFHNWPLIDQSSAGDVSQNDRSMLDFLSLFLSTINRGQMSPDQVRSLQAFIAKLQQAISYDWPGRLKLNLFGSYANGFATPSSDLDMCATIALTEDENSDRVHLLKCIRKQLYRRQKSFQIAEIRPTLGAKIPVLKLEFVNKLHVDISINNTLAIYNSMMLKFYTILLPLTSTLGIALKCIIKPFDLNDAVNNGISSYALIIMIIFFLQQRGYLPVLQEMYHGSRKPETIVEGWNVWFQDDANIVYQLWTPPSHLPSLGQIWLDFFRFYLYQFNRDDLVVCIRQKAPLSKFSKGWDRVLSIEDPFELSRDVAVSLSNSKLANLLDLFRANLSCPYIDRGPSYPNTFSFNLAKLGRYQVKRSGINQSCLFCSSHKHLASDRQCRSKEYQAKAAKLLTFPVWPTLFTTQCQPNHYHPSRTAYQHQMVFPARGGFGWSRPRGGAGPRRPGRE